MTTLTLLKMRIRGLETVEILLVLGILGLILAGILYLLGGAFTNFANNIIATLFSWG
ncbi:MAG: hypothetical protein QW260_05600 [Thermoproteota archaeon]